MSNKKWVIIIVVSAVVILGLVLVFWLRRGPATPPPVQKSPTTTPAFNPPALSDEQAILTIGAIVVRGLGTYQSPDPFFRNLRSVQSYVTAEFYSRLQAIIDRGIDDRVPPFSKTTEVISQRITDRGVLRVEGEYAVRVKRSDSKEAVSDTVRVVFVRIGPTWYVDESSQVK